MNQNVLEAKKAHVAEIQEVIKNSKSFVVAEYRGLTVAEIAYDTGFSSPSYFTKCFKEYFNESPTEYQNRLKHSRGDS